MCVIFCWAYEVYHIIYCAARAFAMQKSFSPHFSSSSFWAKGDLGEGGASINSGARASGLVNRRTNTDLEEACALPAFEWISYNLWALP